MGLIIRLQSAPQSLPAALQRGFITITVNVRAYAHWKTKGAADLIKKKPTMADLTAEQNWTWRWFPHCFWKHVPQSMLPTQPSHSPLAPALNMHITALKRIRCVAWSVRLGAEEEERPLTSLSCAACDCKFKLNFGPFFAGGGHENKKSSFLLVIFLVVWQNEQCWRRKWKCNLDDLLLILFMSQIMQLWPWNEQAFLIMHLHFQIWHFKIKFWYLFAGVFFEN